MQTRSPLSALIGPWFAGVQEDAFEATREEPRPANVYTRASSHPFAGFWQAEAARVCAGCFLPHKEALSKVVQTLLS